MRDMTEGATGNERPGDGPGRAPEDGNVETAFARARLALIQERARTSLVSRTEDARRHAPAPAGEPDRETALWNKAGHYAGVALLWALFVTPVVVLAAIVLS
jgi:hypothetical protein